MNVPSLTILDIQRMSSEDGPGLRTTVFLKGCSLACRWCHNPESIAFNGEVLWHAERCIGCAGGVVACPQQALRVAKSGVCVSRERCHGCFKCCDACPTGALEAKGRQASCEELCRELLKDRAYFGEEGGVTVSGGEALMQGSALHLLRLLKEKGCNTALDTCGLAPEERLRHALDHCDLVLYDLKLADSARHKEWTAAGNELILSNLAVVAEWARAGRGKLWVRTPIIPGATDDEENIRGIGEVLCRYSSAIERWELCAFNNLCASKYKSLDQAWEFEGVPLMERAKMNELCDIAKETRACPDIRWTGAVRE